MYIGLGKLRWDKLFYPARMEILGNTFSRDELRYIAKAIGVPRGRNKADTARNIAKYGSLKVWIEVQR